MIAPTIGRVVWFYERCVPDTAEQALAAIVTYVHSDRLVNLAVFDGNGKCAGRISVPLRQPADVAPRGMFCEWMPYQKGQAVKTEALEAQLKDKP